MQVGCDCAIFLLRIKAVCAVLATFQLDLYLVSGCWETNVAWEQFILEPTAAHKWVRQDGTKRSRFHCAHWFAWLSLDPEVQDTSHCCIPDCAPVCSPRAATGPEHTGAGSGMQPWDRAGRGNRALLLLLCLARVDFQSDAAANSRRLPGKPCQP